MRITATDQGEEGGNDVGQDAGGQRHDGPAPVLAGAQSAGHQAEEQQGRAAMLSE